MNALEWHRALAAAGLPVLSLEIADGLFTTTAVIGVADDGEGVWASLAMYKDPCQFRGVISAGGPNAPRVTSVDGTISEVIAVIAARRTTLDKVHSQE